MEFLLGLAAAAALLYFWLLGHWFARVLALLPFAILTGFCVGAIFSTFATSRHETMLFIVGAILGAHLAWPLASLPIYYWRWRKDSALMRGLAMRYPTVDPIELRKYADEVYGRG